MGSGIFMGLIYNLSFEITSDSATEMADFLWGAFTVCAVMIPIITIERYRPIVSNGNMLVHEQVIPMMLHCSQFISTNSCNNF